VVELAVVPTRPVGFRRPIAGRCDPGESAGGLPLPRWLRFQLEQAGAFQPGT
jgi:hypothetical protein